MLQDKPLAVIKQVHFKNHYLRKNMNETQENKSEYSQIFKQYTHCFLGGRGKTCLFPLPDVSHLPLGISEF